MIFNEDSVVNLPRRNTILVNTESESDEDTYVRHQEKEQNPIEAEKELDEVVNEEIEQESELRDEERHPETENKQTKRCEGKEKETEKSGNRYSLRNRERIKTPKRLRDLDVDIENQINVTEIIIPQNYEEVLRSPEKQNWMEAIEEELESLEVNKTWELTTLPPNKKTIGSKWVFRLKTAPGRDSIRFKARLCAEGFSQIEGVDYCEIFAPTTRYDTIRILLALSVQRKLKINQFDVKTAFLYGELSEEIYMDPPPGVCFDPGIVCKLKK